MIGTRGLRGLCGDICEQDAACEKLNLLIVLAKLYLRNSFKVGSDLDA